MTGTVVRMPEGKNFGFIKVPGEKKDYFFHREDFSGHWSDLTHDFNANKKIEVTFDGEDGQKGPRAINVKRTDWPN